jgi:hypothetical protein
MKKNEHSPQIHRYASLLDSKVNGASVAVVLEVPVSATSVLLIAGNLRSSVVVSSDGIIFVPGFVKIRNSLRILNSHRHTYTKFRHSVPILTAHISPV